MRRETNEKIDATAAAAAGGLKMRCLALGLLSFVVWGCSGQNIVAGEEKTQGEQLESALPSFCASTCTRLRACPMDDCICEGDVCECGGGIDADCEDECADYFEPFLGKGDECAAVGQRLKSCIGALTCDQLGGSNPCEVTDAEEEKCPQGDVGDVSVDVPPSVLDPGPAPGVGGTQANPVVVSCQGGSAAGGDPAAPGQAVICEEQRHGCNDGHEYSWICAQDSAGLRGCTCFQDETVVGAFAPEADCPALSEVNAGCHWALTE